MRFRFLSLLLLFAGCHSLQTPPPSAPIPVNLASAMDRAKKELEKGRWGVAWTTVTNQTENSDEKTRFLASVEEMLGTELDGLKTQTDSRKRIDLEASLALIHRGIWEPQPDAAPSQPDSQPSQWLKGTATVVVNKGFTVVNGVSQPDIVIGSGFFVSSDGYLLTNHHVIESEVEPGPSSSSRLSLRLPGSKGERLPAKVIGWDRNLDLALLKAEYKPEFVFTLSSGTDPVPGQRLQALGSPGGLEATLTEGIVSAVERPLLSVGEVLQIDAAVNPGNSGGPLLDSHGGVVGVVFAGIREFQGVNFAIPTSLVRKALPRLQVGGRAVLPWLGIGLQEDFRGMEVAYVTPRGPGDWAGIRKGDRIVGVAGTPVSEISRAQVRLLDFGIDAIVPVDLERDGKPLRLWSTLEARPELPLKDAAMNDLTQRVLPIAFGVEVEDLGGSNTAFRVRRVWAGTTAEELGLAENDYLEVIDWVADTENKVLATRWHLKRRLGGYLDSVVQFGTSFASRSFL